MSIVTVSGRFVKRPVRTRQIVAALRRAKAPAGMKAKAPMPWRYELTEMGKAAVGLMPMTDAMLQEAAAQIVQFYDVRPEGDHLRFTSRLPFACVGDYARVVVPGPDHPGTVLLGGGAAWPEEAFIEAAALWLRRAGK